MQQTELSPRSRVLIYVLGPMFILGLGAYVTLPLVLHGALCPPGTFKAGPMSSIFWLGVGVFLIIACATILLVRGGTRFPDAGSPQKLTPIRALQKDKIIYLIVVFFGLLVSAVIWWSSLESYYCVTTDKILLHPSAFEPSRAMTWDDVRLVRAECERIKGGYLVGRVVLLLSNQVELNLTFNDQTSASLTRDFETVKTALAERHYRYQVSSSVTPSLCPLGLYSLFLDWHK
jgi:hypothetical protein